MITLKTLPQATAQEVFDQVSNHLKTQGVKARNELGKCKYRLDTGEKVLMCAAGCLMDEEEGAKLGGFSGRWVNLVASGSAPPEHQDLIQSLQYLHDGISVHEWEFALERAAVEHNLVFTPWT